MPSPTGPPPEAAPGPVAWLSPDEKEAWTGLASLMLLMPGRLESPLQQEAGIAVLRGNLCEDGAIIKPSAATPELMKHRGRAVVFESLEDLSARIDAPALDVTPEDFLVLKNAGPKSASGMPEAGYLPIPKKLARAGIKEVWIVDLPGETIERYTDPSEEGYRRADR